MTACFNEAEVDVWEGDLHYICSNDSTQALS